MEIRHFAEQILFGTTWNEKLVPLDHFQDTAPGPPLDTPPAPGRPPGLELDAWHQRDKLRFSDVRHLHSEKERGLVLHFFANHELLALELMALALLRFPDAPEKFRRGLVQTLLDEQEHVRLYRRRMAQVGVEFGEIPVSDFFWKTIAPMQHPADFVTRLSLTLEQANLDYAVHYAATYRQLDDKDTAAILERIYRDEIGHVKHGLVWFNRWRDQDLSEWEAYKNALTMPLTPSRAKGIGFNRDGRRRAGLSEEFIDELEIYAHSKGRCPAAHWFNPLCEGQVARGAAGRFTPAKLPRLLAADFGALPMLICAQDDVVLVRRRPSSAFLRKMQRSGFTLPEFTEYGHENAALAKLDIAGRKLSDLRPWGWSPDAVRFLEPLFATLPQGSRTAAEAWNDEMRPLYSKAWSADLLRAFLRRRPSDADWLCGEDVVGRPCATLEEVDAWVDEFRAAGFDHLVVKAAYGSSGQNQIRFCGEDRTGQRNWVRNILAEQGCVVVEPWLEKVLDLSLQLHLDPAGAVKIAGWTRFFTDARGQYRGSFASRMVDGLDAEVRRCLYGNGRERRRLHRLFDDLAVHVGPPMRDRGCTGPVGIDMLIYRRGDQLRLKPIVEINPRCTMGLLALHLARRVNSARTAVWIVLSAADIIAAGFADVQAFAGHMEQTYPPTLMPDGLQLSSGVLCTTDPSQARAFSSFLLVAEQLDTCKKYFRDLPGKVGAWTDCC